MGKILALITAAILALAVGSAPAQAGGFGDWYDARQCSIGGNTGKVTNYDIGTSDQEYHHSMTSGVNGYYAGKIFYAGTRWPLATGSRGTIRDGYQRFDNPTTEYRVTFEWGNSSGLKYTCYVTL